MLGTTPGSIWRQYALTALAALVALAATAGCTSQKEKATTTIKKAVEACQKDDSKGAFHEVRLFDGSTEKVLKATCDNKLGEFEMLTEFTAKANTGPTVWNASVDEEMGVWVMAGAGWPTLNKALNAIDTEDPTEESMKRAEKFFAESQQEQPQSAWVRLRRLENLLNLRTKTRGKDTPNPVQIGPESQKYFEQTLAWAKENDHLDARVEARYLVVEHIRDHIDRIELGLSASGSQDEWFLKAAKQAEKDGEPDKAEEYRKELAEMQEKRKKDKKILGARKKKAKKYLCEHLAKLSPAGVDDTTLQQRVVAAKNAVDCMKSADDKEVAEGN